MSVTKWGSDDDACGDPEQRHRCTRPSAGWSQGGITVVVAAANDSGSGLGARAGLVQRGHHRLGPRRHRRQARRRSAATAATRGAATTATTRSPTSATTAATSTSWRPASASGRPCKDGSYGYMSGTSMASPTVAGAAALYKASRPMATPAEVRDALVTSGNFNWKTVDRPGRQTRSPARCQPARSARIVLDFRGGTPTGHGDRRRRRRDRPDHDRPQPLHFERVRFSVERPALGLERGVVAEQPDRLHGRDDDPQRDRPGRHEARALPADGDREVDGPEPDRARDRGHRTRGDVAAGHARSVASTRGSASASAVASRTRSCARFQVSGSGIPADAVAVTGNLTVTGADRAPATSRIGPSLSSRPGTSSINVARRPDAGQRRHRPQLAERSTVRGLRRDGRRVHDPRLFDVTGYYRAGDGGTTWYGHGPQRLLDTRTGNGLAGDFIHRGVRSVQIGRSGRRARRARSRSPATSRSPARPARATCRSGRR